MRFARRAASNHAPARARANRSAPDAETGVASHLREASSYRAHREIVKHERQVICNGRAFVAAERRVNAAVLFGETV